MLIAYLLKLADKHLLSIAKGIFWTLIALMGGIILWMILIAFVIILKIFWELMITEVF